MATDMTPASLIHHRTLTSPSGVTRAWSSRPHPSARSPLLATASSDKSVQVWDLRGFKLVSTINGGHKRSVRCVGWKDWGYAGSDIGASKRQKIESSENGGRDGEEEESTAHPTTSKEKAVTLATGSFDSNVGIWVYDPASTSSSEFRITQDELDMTNPPDNEEENEEDWHFTTLLTGPDSEIKDLQFCPPHYGANLLAMCSRDKSVWVWEEVEDDNEWETIAVLGEHTGDVKCVGWCGGARILDEDGDEEIVVGSREILATGSYDDTIRLWRDVEEEGDWMCVAVIDGHKGTVWDVCWEGYLDKGLLLDGFEVREWEPRILSCSDDMTIRLWRRELSETERENKNERLANGVVESKQEKLPSIIKPKTAMEKWVADGDLPSVHVRSVYAVDWSRRTGLVVSCGGDGTIAVYKEILDTESDSTKDVIMNGTDDPEQTPDSRDETGRRRTKWLVVALIEAAHDEYEINHVCWAARRDKEKRWNEEEMIVSTGDDGDVRLWTLPEDVVNQRWKA